MYYFNDEFADFTVELVFSYEFLKLWNEFFPCFLRSWIMVNEYQLFYLWLLSERLQRRRNLFTYDLITQTTYVGWGCLPSRKHPSRSWLRFYLFKKYKIKILTPTYFIFISLFYKLPLDLSIRNYQKFIWRILMHKICINIL